MNKQISVSNLVMLIGGAVTFLFSFFPFIGTSDQTENAWGRSLFPLATIPAILGAAMVVVCVLEQVGSKLPEPVLTFTWRQIQFTWGVVALTIMVAYVVLDTGVLTLKFGAILMLLGSAAMAIGALLPLVGLGSNLLGASGTGQSGRPPSPGSTPPPPPPPVPPATPPAVPPPVEPEQ